MADSLTSTTYIAILGLMVAAYGAILSTINSAVQLLAHRRDRADIVLKVRRNMSTLVESPTNPFAEQQVKKFAIITATNRGKRPVTLQSFAMKLLDTNTESLLVDVRPKIPREITEGQYASAFVDEATPS
jgi:hypothetical protein